MPIRTISFLPLGFVFGLSMLPLSAQERPVDPTAPFRITPPSENWLAGVTIDPPWDKGPVHRDGLPHLPPGHNTTLLSGGGLPQDNAQKFKYLKKQAGIGKDPTFRVFGFDEEIDVQIKPTGADRADEISRLREQLSREGYQAFREDPKKPDQNVGSERSQKDAAPDKSHFGLQDRARPHSRRLSEMALRLSREAEHLADLLAGDAFSDKPHEPTDRAWQRPGQKKKSWLKQKYQDSNEVDPPFRPWPPRNSPPPPAGRPDPEHRIHQLEKELEDSRRREAALRGVVQDLIEQLSPPAAPVPLNPSKIDTEPPKEQARKEAKEASQLYLQGHLTMKDGSELENKKDFAGAYFKLREARDLFDEVFKTDPAWQPEIVEYRRTKIREDMERIRQMEIRRRGPDSPLSKEGPPDRPKKPSAPPLPKTDNP
jgi:hypothetical protein